MWLATLMSAALIMGSSKPALDEAVPLERLEKMSGLLESHAAESLSEARALFESWCKVKPTDEALLAFRNRVTALGSLRDEIAKSLKIGGQEAITKLLAGLGDDVGAKQEGARHAAKSSAKPSMIVPAEQIYRYYLPYFRYSINTSKLKAAEKAFLRAYYNAEVQAAISEIMQRGRVLKSAGDTKSRELENYLILLPLLHSVGQFSVELLRELPDWMITPEHLKTLADFCLLRVERLDAAEAIILNVRRQNVTPEVRCSYFQEAADQCIAAHSPRMAVNCLKASVTLMKQDNPLKAKVRARIYEVWANANNWALAAGEAGQFAREFQGTPEAARALMSRIKYLSLQGDHEAILLEVDDTIKEPLCEQYLPELQFHRWKALRQTGKHHAASLAVKRFLERYPNDPNGAEMYYAVAVDCLAVQRYDEAMNILETLLTRYSKSSFARKAKPLIDKLQQLSGAPEGRTSTRSAPNQ